ncbi:MAG: DUF4245 family protein [Microbacterium sp.]|uniref:DUF4245 family protein n=1 Tax=Microbacterium sp. TaxID=51671 RepID=UPI0039E70370
MASTPRVVAELGRPETPEETTARKAESSRAYRSSQTARNLVAALLATLAIVLVVVLGVPRGGAPAREEIDVADRAQQAQSAYGVAAVVPTVPGDWLANAAAVDARSDVWTIVYALPGESQFIRVSQAFHADDDWALQVLRGASPHDTVTIGGVEWDRYDIADPATTGNVTGALGTRAGADHVLVYGDASDADLELVANSIAEQVRALEGSAE